MKKLKYSVPAIDQVSNSFKKTVDKRQYLGLSLSEEQIQIQVIKECAYLKYEGIKLTQIIRHIPNGGKRSKTEAGKFKAMGVVAGTPDLHLPVAKQGFASLYIEMKDAKGGLTPSQKEQIPILRKLGNKVVICRSADHAIEEIKSYLGI